MKKSLTVACTLVLIAVFFYWLFGGQKAHSNHSEKSISTNQRSKEKYYSIPEIAQMRGDDHKVSIKANEEILFNEDEILSVLQANDICEVTQKIPSLKNDLKSVLETFFRLHSPVQNNLEDVQLIEPMFKGPLRGNPNIDDILPAIKFFNALLFGDMVEGVKSQDLDYYKSVELLERLEANDPSNAAYPFFRAAVLNKMKAPESEIQSVLLEAFNRPNFDTFERRIAEAVYRQSFASVTAYFYAEALLYKMPVVNWSPILQILKKTLGKNPEFDRAAIAFAKRLRLQGDGVDGEFEFILWSAVEYEYANIFEKYAWKSAFPTAPLPKPKRAKDLPKNHSELEILFEKMDAMQTKGAPCDPTVYQKVYDFNLKMFEESLKKRDQKIQESD